MGNGLILFHNLVSLPSSKLGSFPHMAGAKKGKNVKSCSVYFLHFCSVFNYYYIYKNTKYIHRLNC